MEKQNYCFKCGEKLDINENYCPHCGAKVEIHTASEIKAISGKKQSSKFRWKWVLTCIGIVIALGIVDVTAFRVIDNLTPGQPSMVSFITFTISILLIVFIGSFITALFSPGKTIWEAGVACAAIVIIFSFISVNIIGVLFGWVVPFIIGVAGAALGEFASKYKETRQEIPV